MSSRSWFDALVDELFQTERSAIEHPPKEAERLGDTPPAHAMLRVSAHAEGAIKEFTRLLGENSEGGQAAGVAFSLIRDNFADALLTQERSYRATVLGITHGVDLVRTLRGVARELGEDELAAYCKGWVKERSELVERCREEGFAWFCTHPDVATAYLHDDVVAKAKRAVAKGLS